MSNKNSIQTGILHSGSELSKPAGIPDSLPIYHATAYVVEDTLDYDKASNGDKYYYNRSGNPNRDGIATAISYLENGEDTLVTSSGMAAISTTLLSLLKSGDHALFNSAIYAETIEFAKLILAEYGIEVSFTDFSNIENIKSNIKPNTKILYSEIIANPLTEVIDTREVGKIAKENNLLYIVDSTFTTPFAITPLDFGADIVIHSLTKYFGGHSDATGGSITASAKIINYIKPKYLWLGGIMDANTSWLMQRSVQTMQMRVKTQFSNALEVATALEKLPMVKKVHYPGLPSHPNHELAKELFNNNFGAMLSFRLEDDLDKVNEFIRSLKVVKYLGTLGGIKSSLAHPVTAFKSEFTQEELIEMGLFDGLIRISVGAEDPADIINDLTSALSVFK